MTFPLLTPDFRNEFELRLSKVRATMRHHRVDGLLLASTVNIYYLTGGICRGYIYIPEDEKLDPLFLVMPPAELKDPIAMPLKRVDAIPEALAAKGLPAPKRLGIELDDLYYTEAAKLISLFPESKCENGSTIMRETRMIKTDAEIAKMREDGIKQATVYSRIRHCYTEDMTDIEFQTEIEHIMRQEGCLGYLRAAGRRMEINMGSVLAGPNADVPTPYDFAMGGAGTDPSLPVGASGMIMHPGMSVMVDMNGGFNGYQTDLTRVWSIGPIDDKAMRAHQCSRDILRDLEANAKPGVEIAELYRRAVQLASDAGLEEYFMGHRHHAKFIGHGVGIELNEMPVVWEHNHTPLQAGMTIALEPKFVIPGTGAVGVENTYVVREKGLECLTVYPEEIEQL